MRVTRLGPADYRRMPWKNGLGTTTEIARAPLDGPFDWRVSVADVSADGPFSLFPGCDRVILALEGAGMVLTHREPQSRVAIGPLQPWAFSGDWTTTCALRDGPIRDFNVIARRQAFNPRVDVLRPEGETQIEVSASIVLLYCVSGSCTVQAGQTFELRSDETLIFERTGEPSQSAVAKPSATRPILIKVELAR